MPFGCQFPTAETALDAIVDVGCRSGGNVTSVVRLWRDRGKPQQALTPARAETIHAQKNNLVEAVLSHLLEM